MRTLNAVGCAARSHTLEVVVNAVYQDFESLVAVITKFLGHNPDVLFLVLVDLTVNHHHSGEVLQVAGLFIIAFWHFVKHLVGGPTEQYSRKR